MVIGRSPYEELASCKREAYLWRIRRQFDKGDEIVIFIFLVDMSVANFDAQCFSQTRKLQMDQTNHFKSFGGNFIQG